MKVVHRHISVQIHVHPSIDSFMTAIAMVDRVEEQLPIQNVQRAVVVEIALKRIVALIEVRH